jgi:hypothetical protein
VCGSEKGRRAAILAADQLMTRWQGRGRFFQAWGPHGQPRPLSLYHRLPTQCASASLGKRHYG